MHEYPLIFYFLVFVLLILFYPNLSLLLLALFSFLSGLYAHKLFGLFLRRVPFEYPHVFLLPFRFGLAYTLGNSILVSRRFLELPQDIQMAILYHELGHIKFKDFATVFLMVFVYYLVASTKSLFLLASYLLFFVWVYWQMEVRSDLYAKSRGANIERALEEFGLRWRLNFLEGKETNQQAGLIYLAIVFLMGMYVGTLVWKH